MKALLTGLAAVLVCGCSKPAPPPPDAAAVASPSAEKPAATAASTALATTTPAAQTQDDDAGRQVDNLFSARYNPQTPGIAVAIVKDGKTVFQKGYGRATLEHDVLVTTRTKFLAGSVSKQFTSFAIYLLEKRGRLSFEDDIRKHLPEMPDYGKTVRIRHLLAHTSGLRDHGALMSLAGWRFADVVTPDDPLRVVRRQKELNFEPGSAFLYSNTGFTLLAEIVSRVSGRPFSEFLRAEIFAPLGMSDTQIYDDHQRVVENRAYSYAKEDGVYKKQDLNTGSVGSSGLMTTAEDLAKWALNFESPQVGDAEMIARFNEPSRFENGEPVLYQAIEGEKSFHAKGQFTRNYRGVDLLNHTGHTAGFWTYLLRFPAKRLSIILLSNDEHAGVFQTGLTIAGAYLKDDLKPRGEVSNPPAAAQPPPAANDLRDFEGEFASEELAATYTIKAEGAKLIVSHLRLGDIELRSAGKDAFSGTIGFPADIVFTRGAGGRVVGFTASNWGAKNVKFRKVTH